MIHGTRSMFNSGCRCHSCTEAQRERKRQWQAKYRANRKARGQPHRSPAELQRYVVPVTKPTTEGNHANPQESPAETSAKPSRPRRRFAGTRFSCTE